MNGILGDLARWLPALIPILWILRAVSRRRKTAKEATPQVKPQSHTELWRPGKSDFQKKTAPEALFELYEDPVTGTSRPVIRREKFPPQDDSKPETTTPSESPSLETLSPETRVAKPGNLPRIQTAKTLPPLLTHLDRLPPLERAMIWSFILDEPLSIKER